MLMLNQPYYYENLIEDAFLLQKTFPDYIETKVIGNSHDQRDIVMLKVGKGSRNLILTSGVHGRETINPIVLMKMIEFYCKQEYRLLEKHTFYVIPLVNPDGYTIALKGFSAIRNESLRKTAMSTKISHVEWKYNGRGVDINRNFPSTDWRVKGPTDSPGSENETKALIRIFKEIPSIGYIDYHSRGKAIYYYRRRMNNVYNEKQKIIGERLADDLGYLLVPKEEEIEAGDSGGNTVHFYSEHIKQPAITIETVEETEEFPLNYRLQESTFQEILFSPVIMLF